MPFTLSTFSVFTACGALSAIVCLFLLRKKTTVTVETAEWASLLSLPLGAFFGHFLYALLQANMELPMWGIGFLFAPWMGGFMFYGVAAGALAAAFLASRITGGKSEWPAAVDLISVALLLLITVIRVAEPFDNSDGIVQGNGIGLDEFTLIPSQYASLLCFQPYSDYPEGWYLAVFAFEALWAFICFILSAKRLTVLKQGYTSLFALTLYASGTLFFEFIRGDFTVRWRFVRLSQLISAIALAALLICVIISAGKKLSKARIVRCSVAFALCICAIIAVEFGDEKPLILSSELKIFFPHWFTYGILAVVSVIAGIIPWRLLRTTTDIYK